MKSHATKFLTVGMLVVVSSSIYCQTLTKDQLSYLQKNSKTVCQDSISEPEWDAVAKELKDKRFILLGEFNHGSKEIFELRNSLIKYLHEKQGINIILFESGIGELITADLNKRAMTAGQMTNGFFGGWRTKEFADLMGYVKSENLSIAGFDVQRSGGSFLLLLKSVCSKKNIDSTLYVNLEARYSQLNRELSNSKAIYDSLKTKTQKLIADYKTVLEKLSASSDTSKEMLLSIATIKNRIRYLSYMMTFLKDRNWSNRWAARDSAMAENIQWLVENIYKNERVIIVAHNFHIERYSENETVMGEILDARYGKEMFVMGVFAGMGSFSNNAGKEQQMLVPDSTALDIKHIIQKLNGTANYISIPKSQSKGNEWLYEPIVVNDTFIDVTNTNNKLNLSKSFDGLLLLNKVSPPK